MSRSLQLVLTTAVQPLGKAGDVVTVSPGYAHNFLLPQKKAVIATPDAIARAASEKQRADESKRTAKIDRQNARERVDGSTITIGKRANEKGSLYAAVTAGDIVRALSSQGVHGVDPKAVTITEPIRSIGRCTVSITFGDAGSAACTVEVVAA